MIVLLLGIFMLALPVAASFTHTFFLLLLLLLLVLKLFFFFRRASSNLRDFHGGFRTKQQHFSLSSAPAHCFFPSLMPTEQLTI